MTLHQRKWDVLAKIFFAVLIVSAVAGMIGSIGQAFGWW